MQSGARALANHLALEFGGGAEHLHQHAAGRAGGVDRLGQRPEFCAGGADPFEHREKVFERAGHAVEPPDFAGAELVEHLVQLGVLPRRSGGPHARMQVTAVQGELTDFGLDWDGSLAS